MNFSGAKTLIFGGSGFLGSHLTETLIQLGAVPIIADIQKPQIKVQYIECDITNSENMKKLPKDIDYVFHLAAVASPRECEMYPELAFKTNVGGTFNVIDWAMKSEAKKIVFSSAAALYGRYPKYIPIDENHPIELDNIYTTTKRFGEMLLESYHNKYGLPMFYFRIFNTYGPRQKTEYFVPTVVTNAIKTGKVEIKSSKPVRDFIYAGDVAKAMMLASQTKYCGLVNLGTGNGVSTGELASTIAEMVSKDCKVKSAEEDVTGPMVLICDNYKAKNVLKWNPSISLKEGIKKTIEWYRK